MAGGFSVTAKRSESSRNRHQPSRFHPAAKVAGKRKRSFLLMEINDKQSLALNEIVGGLTVTEAAEKAGVTRQTVHEWLANPEVEEKLIGAEALWRE